MQLFRIVLPYEYWFKLQSSKELTINDNIKLFGEADQKNEIKKNLTIAKVSSENGNFHTFGWQIFVIFEYMCSMV